MNQKMGSIKKDELTRGTFWKIIKEGPLTNIRKILSTTPLLTFLEGGCNSQIIQKYTSDNNFYAKVVLASLLISLFLYNLYVSAKDKLEKKPKIYYF